MDVFAAVAFACGVYLLALAMFAAVDLLVSWLIGAVVEDEGQE